MEVLHPHSGTVERPLVPQDDGVSRRVLAQDVQGTPPADPQAPALSDGVAGEAPVPPQHPARRVHKIPRLQRQPPVPEEGGVVPAGDKADVLTVRLPGAGEAPRLRKGPHIPLLQLSQRQKQPAELLLGEGVEEIALVLAPVPAPEEPPAARAGVEIHPGIVPRGDAADPQVLRPAQKGVELHKPVAPDAGVGGAPVPVGGGEVRHHLPPEELLAVEHEKVRPQAVRRPAGVLNVLQAAAGPLLPVQGGAVVELQGTAGDSIARLLQKRRRRGAVHAAAHAHQHAISLHASPPQSA